MKLSAIARMLPGSLSGIKIARDSEFDELGLTATRSCGKVLCFLESGKYAAELVANPAITCVLTTSAIAAQILEAGKYGVAVSDEPRLIFFTLHNMLAETPGFYRTNEPTRIHPTAKIAPTSWIAPENVVVGENSVIGPNTSVHSGVMIGKNVTIGDNCVIGGEGFECFRYGDKVFSVRSSGGVQIRDYAAIHSCTCIDKGIFKRDTIIGEYCMIDNLIHIAHDVELGRRVFVVAGAMVAGRVVIGDDSWVGPSSSVRNGCTIGEKGFVSMGAVVTRNVEPEQTVSGNFAIEHTRFIEYIKSIR